MNTSKVDACEEMNKRKAEVDELVKQRKVSLETHISIILNNGYLSALILSLLSVAELVTCKQVSKKWMELANDDAVWLHKYRTCLGITGDKASAGVLPSGHFRRMYLDRFGRNEWLAVMLHAYRQTKDPKYLKAIARIATTTALHYATEEDCRIKVYECPEAIPEAFEPARDFPAIFINKSVDQSATYLQGAEEGAKSLVRTISATMYAHTSTRSVKIGIYYAHASVTDSNSGKAEMVVLYDDSVVPEHLCKFLSSDEEKARRKSEQFTQFGANFVEPIQSACDKLIAYLDIPPTITARQLVYTIKQSTFFTLDDTETITDTDVLDDVVIAYEGDLACKYKTLAGRAQGELQLIHALKEAKARKFKPEIISLLEKTLMPYSLVEQCGFASPQIFGPSFDEYGLGYQNCSSFEVTIPNYGTIKLDTDMINNIIPELLSSIINPDLRFQVAIGHLPIFAIDSMERASSDRSATLEVSLLNEIVNKMNVPGFTHVDFFAYILVAGNLLDQLFIEGQPDVEWWTLDSLEGIKLEQTESNKTREPLYQRMQEEAESIRKELHWHVKQPKSILDTDEDDENDEDEDDGDEYNEDRKLFDDNDEDKEDGGED